MAGGYSHSPAGMDGLAAMIAGLQRQIDALRSTTGLTSAKVRGGLIEFTDADGNRITTYGTFPLSHFPGGTGTPYPDRLRGTLFSDPVSGLIIFMAGSWESDAESAVQIGDAGNAAALSMFRVYARDTNINAADYIALNADTKVFLNGDTEVQVNTPYLTLYGIPSVGAPGYMLGYNFDGTNWSVCFTTSSARYKQDIETADLDPDAVLGIRPVTFRDISSVEKSGDDAPVNFGVIAEELHDLGLGDLLVTYKDGEPDAVKYDRIAVALLPVVKRQAAQIADLTARLDALETDR